MKAPRDGQVFAINPAHAALVYQQTEENIVSGIGVNNSSYWEAEGRRLGPLLDDVYATVVAATDNGIAASVALGLARAQGTRRRVAIADLVGELPQLEALLTGDDPHGVADSFRYGVSLNKIARPINQEGSIFLMPSGTESVANVEIYDNDRWRRLAAGFHEVGALLLVVADSRTAGFAELCSFIGALTPAGESTNIEAPAGVRLIAPPTQAAPSIPLASLKTPARVSTAKARAVAAEDSSSRRRNTFAFLLVVAVIASAIGAFLWPRIQPLLPASIVSLLPGAAATNDSSRIATSQQQEVTRESANDAANTVSRDSSIADSIAKMEPLAVSNPGDSTRSSRYSIYFTTANTRDAAMPDKSVLALPAVAMSPVREGSEVWYRVTIGASADRQAANAMLTDLRSREKLTAGNVLDVPYALLLDQNIAAAEVNTTLNEYMRRGIIAYALRQANGQATIMTGAFENPGQSNILADSLQRIGITPVLIYRTGRTF